MHASLPHPDNMNAPNKVDIPQDINLPLNLFQPMPEHGLKTLLQHSDDILFVLDHNGQVLSCKSRSGEALRNHSLHPQLHVQELLPSKIKRKFDTTFQQFRLMSHPAMFDSMIVLPPHAANWYEFRFIPAFENQIVLFIWNVNAYRELTWTISNLPTSVEKLIEGWSRSLYLRDFETEGHTRRVTEMAVQLARRLGLPEEELTNIRRGAQVHDIGKIAIPDEILLKTGKLTEEEWDVMRQHPLIAVEMLKLIPEFEPALVIPRSHHEKWDGSGYPDGLAGAEIPLPARIFAFADVYDALTSNRPYRQAWSRADTLRYIRAEIGRHFDPALTPEFIRLMLETA